MLLFLAYLISFHSVICSFGGCSSSCFFQKIWSGSSFLLPDAFCLHSFDCFSDNDTCYLCGIILFF
uniref:Secreted protein n=1 Tax=Rhizophora mucronata TaxID=61149 RepID=A0A2P2KJ00_RHIMU